MQIMKILEIQVRITKIMKILETHVRIMTTIKILEIQCESLKSRIT